MTAAVRGAELLERVRADVGLGLRIRCPKCRALPGRPCWGGRPGKLHTARQLLELGAQ